jgi:hypothetical protein
LFSEGYRFDIYGIPKNNGNLNTLGLHAPFQMSDFVETEKPTNIETAHAAAAVIALADPDILLTKLARSVDSFNPSYQAIGLAPYFGRIRTTNYPYNNFFGGGLSTPNTANESANEKSVAEIYKEYGTYDPYLAHPGAQYVDKYGCNPRMRRLC